MPSISLISDFKVSMPSSISTIKVCDFKILDSGCRTLLYMTTKKAIAPLMPPMSMVMFSSLNSNMGDSQSRTKGSTPKEVLPYSDKNIKLLHLFVTVYCFILICSRSIYCTKVISKLTRNCSCWKNCSLRSR